MNMMENRLQFIVKKNWKNFQLFFKNTWNFQIVALHLNWSIRLFTFSFLPKKFKFFKNSLSTVVCYLKTKLV